MNIIKKTFSFIIVLGILLQPFTSVEAASSSNPSAKVTSISENNDIAGNEINDKTGLSENLSAQYRFTVNIKAGSSDIYIPTYNDVSQKGTFIDSKRRKVSNISYLGSWQVAQEDAPTDKYQLIKAKKTLKRVYRLNVTNVPTAGEYKFDLDGISYSKTPSSNNLKTISVKSGDSEYLYLKNINGVTTSPTATNSISLDSIQSQEEGGEMWVMAKFGSGIKKLEIYGACVGVNPGSIAGMEKCDNQERLLATHNITTNTYNTWNFTAGSLSGTAQGNYRFVVRAYGTGAGVGSASRFVTVKKSNYPTSSACSISLTTPYGSTEGTPYTLAWKGVGLSGMVELFDGSISLGKYPATGTYIENQSIASDHVYTVKGKNADGKECVDSRKLKVVLPQPVARPACSISMIMPLVAFEGTPYSFNWYVTGASGNVEVYDGPTLLGRYGNSAAYTEEDSISSDHIYTVKAKNADGKECSVSKNLKVELPRYDGRSESASVSNATAIQSLLTSMKVRLQALLK